MKIREVYRINQDKSGTEFSRGAKYSVFSKLGQQHDAASATLRYQPVFLASL